MSNTYDQASRYLVRRDPPGLLSRFFARFPGTTRFVGWLDTRNVPFPGEADRTGDMVACMEDSAEPGPLWAVPLEFQSTPDPEIFGRYLEFMGALWRQKRPPDRPKEHYCIVGCLVNLTGNPNSSRDYHLGTARTHLQLAECNIATMDAAAVLNAIAAGEVTRWVLPLIPLMQKGGEPGIITQWLELARADPDERNRGDYGGLALVFAELADCRPTWKLALMGWNMQVSQQVLEWQAEAATNAGLKVRREYLQMLLQDRFGPLPESLLQRIDATGDLERLQNAFRQAIHLQKLEDLQL